MSIANNCGTANGSGNPEVLQYLNFTKNPDGVKWSDLPGREQFKAFMSVLFPLRGHTEFVWVYTNGNAVPFRFNPGTNCGNTVQFETTVEITKDEQKTKKQLKKDGKGNLYTDRFIQDAYGHLSNVPGDSGVTINHSYGGFGHEKEHCSTPHNLVIEFDALSRESQNAIVKLFEFFGFPPTAVVHSGGKSLHVWWKLTGTIDLDKWIWLSKQFQKVGADPAILGQIRRLVRCPGEFGGRVQALECLAPQHVYTLEQIESGFSALLEARGEALGSFEEFQAEQEKERAERAKKQASYSNNYDHADSVALVKLCLDSLPATSDGDSKRGAKIARTEWLSAFWGVCKVTGSELATELFSAHSPGRNWRQYSDWEQKSDASLGSLIKLAQDHGGFQFPDWWWAKYSLQTVEFDVEQWLQKKIENYRKNKLLTPTQTINVQYLSEIYSTPEGIRQYNPKGKILLFKSGTGTGKTRSLLKAIDIYCRDTSNEIEGFETSLNNIVGGALLGSRNALLLNICATSKGIIKHHNTEKKHLNFSDFLDWIALCVDSLLKIPLEWWENRIIVIDEIVSVLNHLLFSQTLKDKRREVIDRFIHALKTSAGIMGYDGHLNDSVVEFLKLVCPDKSIEVISNECKPERPKILFLEGTNNGDKFNPNDHSPLTKHIQATIAKQPILIGTDSLVFCNSQRDRLDSNGYKGIVISSETVGLKATREFLSNPTAYLEKHQLDYVIMTPSAESGLDISINGYFKCGYFVFFGVIDCDGQRQMIMRLRDVNVPRYVWMRNWSAVPDSQYDRKVNLHSLLSAIVGEANQLNLDNPQAIIDFAKQSIDSFSVPALELANRSIENWTYERFNIRNVFLDAVAHDGFPVENLRFEIDRDEKATQKAASDAVKERESTAIYNAPDTYLDKPHTILPSSKLNDPAHVMALKKAQLVAQLPGVNQSTVWSPDFIRFITYSRPNLINQRTRLILSQNLELAKKLASKRYSNMVARGGLSPLDFKAIYLEAKAIAASGILELLPDTSGHIDHSNRKLDADHPTVKQIIQNCKQSKVWKGLGRKPGTNPMSFINWLIRRLGHNVTTHKTKDMEGNVICNHSIATSDIESKLPFINAVDQLLFNKLDNIVLTDSDRDLLENKNFDFAHFDPPQTLTGQSFETVADEGQKTIEDPPTRATEDPSPLYQSLTGGENPLNSQGKQQKRERVLAAGSIIELAFSGSRHLVTAINGQTVISRPVEGGEVTATHIDWVRLAG